MKNDLKNFILPGRLRKKDGYYHMIIDTKHPVTGEVIRHSSSTKLKVNDLNKTKSNENLEKAYNMLTKFRKKWTYYYLKEKNEEIYFVDYLRKWLSLTKPNVENSTYRTYKLILERRIIPYFEPKNLLLEEVKAKDIQEFYEYCATTYNLNPNTIIRYHANIRKALQVALKQGMITSNQADLVEKPPKKRYIANVLNPEELKMVLDEIKGTHLELPTYLAMYYGLRRGEVLGILWSNINFENKELNISNTLILDENKKEKNRRSLKTQASHRKLPLDDTIIAYLKELKKLQEKNKDYFKGAYSKEWLDNICVKENGEIIRLDYVTKKFTEISRKLGFKDIHFHCLRHSFATNMHRGGMTAKELQAWLGHANVYTTYETYIHLFKERINETADIVTKINKKLGEIND